jgi:hypothetical protein
MPRFVAPDLHSRASITLALLALCLGGCATYQPTPKGYAGPTAEIADSSSSSSGSCGDFFYLDSYDGHGIENTLSVTERRNYGRGLVMDIEQYSRPVPVRQATLHLIGRTHCAAPIVEVAQAVYRIEGDVAFTPKAGVSYDVTGGLSQDHSAIWIEDSATHRQQSSKLLVRGSTAMNHATLLLVGPAFAKSTKNVETIPVPESKVSGQAAGVP